MSTEYGACNRRRSGLVGFSNCPTINSKIGMGQRLVFSPSQPKPGSLQLSHTDSGSFQVATKTDRVR